MNAINPPQQAAGEAKRYAIPYDVLLCRETGVVRDFKVTKLPHLFIIDPQGIVRESQLFLKGEKIKEIVDLLLAEQTKAKN